MDTTQEDTKVLGLTSAEETTLESLFASPSLSVSDLSRKAALPRMTIYACLLRLHERGLVRKVAKGKRTLWKFASESKVKERFKETLSFLEKGYSKEQLEEDLGLKVSESTEFFVFRGPEQMVKTYQWFLLNHWNKRVLAIQTAASAETFLNKVPVAVAASINDLIKQNKVILEAVLPEGIKQVYTTEQTKNPEWARHFGGRSTAISLVPDQYLALNADMLIGSDTALLANWAEEVLILIKNPDLVLLLRNMFNFMRETGKSFDQNAFVRGLIEDRGKSV